MADGMAAGETAEYLSLLLLLQAYCVYGQDAR